MKLLVTGCAGFIGWFVTRMALDEGHEVVGVDNLNDAYDPRLKTWRLEDLRTRDGFVFHRVDVAEMDAIARVFREHRFDAVLHLAARAGVRQSMENPWEYLRTNATGTLNVLELMRRHGVPKMVLASTSSLYAGQPMPFVEDLPANEPLSPYAASKKAAEVMAYSYHHLYGLDVTVLRYFTVYGPAGRPDMSIFRFIWWMLSGRPIVVYGDGTQSRDFTYVEDIARGTLLALTLRGFQIINLGSDEPHELMEVIRILEALTGRKATMEHRPFHRADVKATWADIRKARDLMGWEPRVTLRQGLERTVMWMQEEWSWVRDLHL